MSREDMTSAERIRHLKLMVEAHEWHRERVNRSVHRNPTAKHYATRLWDAQVLNRAGVARLIGASRPTIYEWFPVQEGEPKRLRAPKDFGSLRYLLTALENREAGTEVNWGQVTGDLRGSGVPLTLIEFLCGPEKVKLGAPRTDAFAARSKRNREKYYNQKQAAPPRTKPKKPKAAPAPAPEPPEEYTGDTDDLRTEVRPDDQGHSESGEGFSIRLYKDPVDHGPAYSTAESESDHAGDVLGAASRGSDDDTESDEGESRVADNGLVDPATLSDAEYIQALEDGSTWVQEGRMPFDIEPIDLDGDSYLEDLPHPPSSDGLAAKFQAWEQADS